MNSHSDSIEVLRMYLVPLFRFILPVGIIIGVMWLGRKSWIYLRLAQRDQVSLELTPPSSRDRTPAATNQLFVALHGLSSDRRFIDILKGRRVYFSLEIVSSKKEGIRYIVRCGADMASSVEQVVASYSPDTRVKRVPDYLSRGIGGVGRVLQFKQSAHFVYPLKSYPELTNFDPISYLTSTMTKLEDGELISLQLVLNSRKVRAVRKLNQRLMRNDELGPSVEGINILGANKLSSGVNRLLFSIADLAGGAYSGQQVGSGQKALGRRIQAVDNTRPVRNLSQFEQELAESMHSKLEEQLFGVDIRVLVQTKNRSNFKVRKTATRSALNLYTQGQYQSLSLKSSKGYILSPVNRFVFRNRLPSLRRAGSSILGISELASLYHFPHTVSAKTENVVRSLSKTLPAPLSLKNTPDLDVFIGKNIHHGSMTPIGLSSAERERHMYVIGGTGNGKTTMLLYMIIQDIRNGKGIAVVDPHGDLAETILRYIPKERREDVIYFNPDDLSKPLGVNLLELPEGLAGDELLREKDLITESVISIFRKIFSEDDSGGHRVEYVLRNTIQTALTVPGCTLFTIFRLLNDSGYNSRVVRELEDQDLKNFWKNEINKAGDFQKVKMAAGITSKIGRFLFSASARRILEQEQSTIDFDEILDSSKILICNFSKGLIGEDTSALFGTAVLAKLQIAALRRARLKQEDRRPFYLYVDEFQNFATMSFVQMLSEARKYKLLLTMAQQSTSQQDKQRLIDIILANVGTVVSFRSGSPADENYILPLFSPYIEKGEIASLPAYNFYTRISAIIAQEPLSGSTVLINEEEDEDGAREVVALSRERYGRSEQSRELGVKKNRREVDLPVIDKEDIQPSRWLESTK